LDPSGPFSIDPISKRCIDATKRASTLSEFLNGKGHWRVQVLKHIYIISWNLSTVAARISIA